VRNENDEAVISLITKSGWKQVYRRKRRIGCRLTNGVKRRMTPEQFISIFCLSSPGIKKAFPTGMAQN